MLFRNSFRCANLLRHVTNSWQKCVSESTQATGMGKVTDGFVEDLRGIVGKSNVSTAEAVRDQHGHDESYYLSSPPDVVVFASNVDDVSKVAQLCNNNRVPLIPFGTGTGLEGGVNAVQGGVSLDLTKMDRIVAFHAGDFDCTVEPGVTRDILNSYIRDTGLTFPIDPGADASLCGMCATSASGTNAVRYGTMRENTLNMEVVLADGSVLWTAGKGKRCTKTSAGYNLTNLFVGSEGTLGIITKTTIRLHAIPEVTLSAVVHFPGVQQAVDTTVQVLQSGVPVARIEFLDEVAIDAFNKYSKFDMKVAPSLFLEFHGSASAVEEQAAVVDELASIHGGSNFKWATDPEERNKIWKARHELLYACMALVPNSKPYSTDGCVPISNLTEAIMKTKEMLQKADIMASILGHVGDGNFHCLLLGDASSEQFVAQTKNCSRAIGHLAMELNGTCTGEHGVGLGKRELLERELGPAGMAAMRTIKQAFDPNNILNPGKLFL